MPRSFSPAVVALGCLLLSPPAFAAEGGSGGGSGGSGADWDVRTAVPAADPAYVRAVVEVKAGRYANAVPLLVDLVGRNPGNADGFNMLGYSHRKLGQRDYAMIYYAEALRLDPKHLGALEYQGELFVELGDLGRAQANLDLLAKLCGQCEEHDDLAQAIGAYRAKPKA